MALPTRPRLRLGDLLAEESFGLELVAGGPEAAAREVRGAHAVEVEAPERWLARDWIMLTTGVRLHGSADAQRALVPALEAAGVAGLGFGVGLGFEQVPDALAATARERGFPVFAVPYATPFRAIVRFVEGVVAGSDEHVFRRLTALQRYLVDALGSPEPERAVVDRLAAFLEAGVLVLDADGEPERAAGPPPPAAVRVRLDGPATGTVELEADGWHVVAAPVAAHGGAAPRRLVLASRRAGFATRLARAAAETTTPLLAAMTRLGDVVRDQEEAVKAALLEEALEPAEARDALPLGARAAAFGIDFACPARVAVLRAGDIGAVRRRLRAELERARLPHLLQPRGDALVALVQAGDEELGAALGAVTGAGVSVGVGRAVAAMAGAHHSLRDAELAAAQGGARVTRFEDVDLGTFMVSEIPPERLEPRVEEILSVLRPNPPLHEAVSAYFAHDLDVAAAAEALHMHRNSLRYRLARMERLLGRSLKRPATIAAVYVALAAEAAAHDGRA